MSDMVVPQLSEVSVKDAPRTQVDTVDSAVSMTFPENVENDLASFEGPKIEPNMDHSKINHPFLNNRVNSSTNKSGIVLIDGVPFKFSTILMMGEKLTRSRREKAFPNTITPSYNLKAIIDDYEDLIRLEDARKAATDPRDDAFRPDVASLYIKIQRRIQDRDLTHGEVAADSNVRARLSGFANSTGAETGMYNLMRHAMNSVLRLNNLTIDSDNNHVDTVVTRVVNEIRATVQEQAARGAHGVNEHNMDAVMEHVFSAIEDALGDRVESQADRLDANATRFDASATRADQQINAIAGHVNAIDNHVHAMGNNVNAMGALLNSTNGNVTSLTASIGVLQTIVNMLPQMVAQAVQDMIPEIVGNAVESSISNDLINRMQAFADTVREAGAREGADGRPPSYRGRSKKRSWFNNLNIFKKHNGRRTRLSRNIC